MKKILILFILIVGLAFAFLLKSDKNDFKNEDIQGVEKLLALNFTETERDSMLENLAQQREDYKSIRSQEIKNSTPPSISFNPLPLGFKIPEGHSLVNLSNKTKIKRPAKIDDIAFFSIKELAYLIKSKQISSLELTKFYIDRLKKFDKQLHCVISFTEERAIRLANKADKEIASGKYKGYLHGIPFGAKDLLSTKDAKTTWGAEPYKNQQFSKDAEVIRQLENVGAILVAKLSLGALAWGDVWFGEKTRNPWNTKTGSSGSSAGSASAVSAGLVPFAIGSETWGSIVSPSTVCGVSGLRPTYGRVSRSGAMALSWSMDKLGPICRNAEDLAIVFNSMIGEDPKDQTLIKAPFQFDEKMNIKNLRIGYVKSDFDQDYPFKKNDSLALAELRKAGVYLIPIELPDYPLYDLGIILSAEAAAAFDQLTLSGKDDLMVRQIKNAWPNVFRSARSIPAVEYINANRLRFNLIQDMEKLMKRVDLYLTPSFVGKNLLLTNLTGHPSVVLPNGFDNKNMPTSFTITGKLFEEGKIIRLAKLFQQITNHHKKHPKL